MANLRHVFIMTMVILFGLSATSSAQLGKSSGVFKIVKGDVKIRSGRDKTILKAEIGTKIYSSDTVITGPDSRAKIEMIDKNELNVSPSSEIIIQKYEFEPAKEKKNVLLNVISGKVRAKVNQKYDGQASNFKVVTPSAVAGVRGTDFLTSYTPSTKSSQVVTFQGSVEWGQKGPDNTVSNPVTVTMGQTSQTSGSAPPSQPAPMPASELKQMDSESKAESAPNKSADSGSSPNSSSKGGDKKESADKNEPESKKESSADKGDKTEKTEKADSGKSDGGGKSEPAKGNDAGKGNANADNKDSGGSGGGGKNPPPAAAANSNSGGSGSDSGGSRGPASVGPGPTAGGAPPPTTSGGSMAPAPGAGPMPSMIKPGDIPSTAAPLPTIFPTVIAPPPVNPISTIPNLTTIPKCEFCNTIIQDGSSKANVKIHIITSP